MSKRLAVKLDQDTCFYCDEGGKETLPAGTEVEMFDGYVNAEDGIIVWAEWKNDEGTRFTSEVPYTSVTPMVEYLTEAAY